MSLAVATTILQQLGGARFMAMTGCRHPSGGENFLQLNLRRNKSGAQFLRITLTSEDLYDVEFYKVNGKTFVREVKERHEGVFCDMLAPIFEKATGLATKLF